jgi:hypothetical protein
MSFLLPPLKTILSVADIETPEQQMLWKCAVDVLGKSFAHDEGGEYPFQK